jgi:hypothetical protein
MKIKHVCYATFVSILSVFNLSAAPPLTDSADVIDFEQQAALSGWFTIVPDCNAAVGPNHIVTVVN